MTIQEEAIALISSITESFGKGYRFYSIKNNRPLLTTDDVITALLKDKNIIVDEPDGEWDPVFHKR